MGTLRTRETEAAYTKHKQEGGLQNGCVLCKAESVQEFKEWRIITNEFPYDLVTATHHMLLPKRHVDEDHLTESEAQEFKEIKNSYLQAHYQFLIEPVRSQRSIPDHWHLHMIVSKYDY